MSDEEYFKDRQMEDKYYWQAERYIEYFKPKKVLDVGCALGHFVHAFDYYGVDAHGCDISVYAIDNTPYEKLKKNLKVGDIKKIPFADGFADLVVCYDVLEHLNEDEIKPALQELYRVSSKNLLASICMWGDSNYFLDKTHQTYRTRAWWEHQISEAGFKVKLVPNNFYFAHQMIIAEKVEKSG